MRYTAACMAAMLVGCAGMLPPLPTPAPTKAAFEQAQRDLALTREREGRLAEAAIAWEVLAVLRPDERGYHERLAALRRRIDATVAERMQRASRAQQRGELDAAARYYLSALALQPDQAQAADNLRSIERERNRRLYLGKLSRNTLMGKAPAPREMRSPRPAGVDRNDIEHASMLARQGEFNAAIVLLERYLAADPRDEVARSLLADAYYQHAEALAARDRAAAIAALERCMRLDPDHARAAARLKQFKTTQPRGAAPLNPNASDAAGGMTLQGAD